MSDRRQSRELEKVVNRVMKTAAKYDRISKTEFEAILHKIMQQVAKNAGADPEEIAAVTSKMVEDMPNEYGQLNDEDRSMEAMIAYLDSKYLNELGQ